jgi:hypothetical protein
VALRPDELTEAPEIERQMRAIKNRSFSWRLEAEAEERHVYHPLRDNKRLLEVLAR